MKIIAQAIREYANALGDDPYTIHGRAEQTTLRRFATAIEAQDDTRTIQQWRELAGLCQHGAGQWDHHCGNYCDEDNQ